MDIRGRRVGWDVQCPLGAGNFPDGHRVPGDLVACLLVGPSGRQFWKSQPTHADSGFCAAHIIGAFYSGPVLVIGPALRATSAASEHAIGIWASTIAMSQFLSPTIAVRAGSGAIVVHDHNDATQAAHVARTAQLLWHFSS